ncbi:type II toxin-antitoxin system VapC family toxin [Mycobacterium sp.]|uniref:type II toxin-antitoxin system VapC family toxin n=1 Tax=Mycobacterium sp. TaxID=1785 RepID=UPI0031D184B5
MIFVDTNVFMYAVGRDHPLRTPARDFFAHSVEQVDRLVTSAEVIHELLHAYLPVGRVATLDAALTLARSLTESWPVEPADVFHARSLHNRHRGLGARDLLHLACCQRRGVTRIKTFDRTLASAFGS